MATASALRAPGWGRTAGGAHVDFTRNLAALLDHQLAIADLAAHLAGTENHQLLPHGQRAVEVTPDFGDVDVGRTPEGALFEIWITRESMVASTVPSTTRVSQSVISTPLSLMLGPTVSLLPVLSVLDLALAAAEDAGLGSPQDSVHWRCPA